MLSDESQSAGKWNFFIDDPNSKNFYPKVSQTTTSTGASNQSAFGSQQNSQSIGQSQQSYQASPFSMLQGKGQPRHIIASNLVLTQPGKNQPAAALVPPHKIGQHLQVGILAAPGAQGQGNFYYYDMPVAINGKQMNMPANSGYAGQSTIHARALQHQNIQQQQLIKKGGSTGGLIPTNNAGGANIFQAQQHHPHGGEYHGGFLIHYDYAHIANQHQEELMRQAMLQEILMQAQHQNLDSQIYLNALSNSMNNGQQNQPFLQSLLHSQNGVEGTTTTSTALSRSSVPAVPAKKVSKIPFANAYVEDCYKFIVVPGNNSGLIRKALERRDWWIEIPPVHSMYNFKWQPVSYGIKFERLGPPRPKPGEIGATGMSSAMSGVTNFPGGGTTSSGQPAQNNSQMAGGNGSSGTGGYQDFQYSDIKQMVNHLEFHHVITEKAALFHEMSKHCDAAKENVFDVCLPITFYVEINDIDKTQSYNQIMAPFISYYQTLEENKERVKQIKESIAEYKKNNVGITTYNEQQDSGKNGETMTSKEKEFFNLLNNKNKDPMGTTTTQGVNKITKFKTFNFEKRTTTKYSMPVCHFEGYNLWLLKPTHLNRGRGIHVFRDLDSLHKLIREYCQGKDEEIKVAAPKKVPAEESPEGCGSGNSPDANNNNDPNLFNPQSTIVDPEGVDQAALVSSPNPTTKKGGSPGKKKAAPQAFKIKHNTFIIQKYIERPLLLYNRKFDIRVWVLLDQDHDLYVFKEGYLRTSSSEFKVDLQNIDDQYVHLTNNAVQKYSENYGTFEDGNQLSYKRFQEIINDTHPDCGVSVYGDIIPQIKDLIVKSMHAVKKKLDPHRRKHCFELFGYDFILDEDFNVWLIEVNTNPCIEESSVLLKMLLPRMIEDMLRITVDRAFPRIGKRGWQTGGQRNNGQKLKQNNNTVVASPVKSNNTVKHNNKPLDKIPEEGGPSTTTEPTAIAETTEPPRTPDTQANKTTNNSRIHPVTGYPDNENMWEKVWSLEKTEYVTRYPNYRSEFLFQVNESKQFKVKRNPLYKKVHRELMKEREKQAAKEQQQQMMHHSQQQSEETTAATASTTTHNH